jgi:probable phosphoglycerate mutase
VSRRLVVEADGGSRGNPGPAGYGAVVRDADTGEVLREVAAAVGVATNNVAEYRGLIAALQAARELEPSAIEVRMDSKLVVEQMTGNWRVKHADMRTLAAEAAALVRTLPLVTFRHVRREQNQHADRLANEAMDAAARGLPWTASEPVRRSERLVGWMAEPAPPTVTWLLRHGETEWSVERRFSGRGDMALNENGVAQARAAARRLGQVGITRIVSSPLRRARQTAEEVAAALDLDLLLEDGLCETDFGSWEGLTFAEVQDSWPEQLTAWLSSPDVAPPDGESFEATERRVRVALDRLLAEAAQQTVCIVSHVTPIKTLVRLALEAPPRALYRMHLDVACLSEVHWYPDGPAVLRLFNDTSHLS